MFSIVEQVFLEHSGLATCLYHLSGFLGLFICMPGYFWAFRVSWGAPSGFPGRFVTYYPTCRIVRQTRRQKRRESDACRKFSNLCNLA